LHGRHSNQKVMGQIEIWHGVIVTACVKSHNFNLLAPINPQSKNLY
jgi:hypothetical protein